MYFRVNDINNATWNRCQKQVTVVACTHACLPDQSNCPGRSFGLPRTLFAWVGEFAKMWCWSKKVSTEGGLVQNVFNIGTVTFQCATKSGACKHRSPKLEWFSYFNLLLLNCIKLYRIEKKWNENIDTKIAKFEFTYISKSFFYFNRFVINCLFHDSLFF